MIPKIIYGAWFGNELPEKYKPYIESWSKLNPDYEIKMIGNDNVKLDSVITESFARKKYCVASNYIRIKQLYDTGGIYLDTDIEVVKSFDSLLHNKLVIAIEDKWVVNGAVILAEKNHPFLKRCLEFIDKYGWIEKDIDLETGPRMMTKIAREYGWKEGMIGQFKDISILPPVYFYPYHYTEKFSKEYVKKETFTIHHWEMSWGEKVSIVIPCYNQGKFLSDAIDSCLDSIYKNIEIIVVNDGSTDNTKKVALSYGNKIKYIEQENKGLSAARNNGIKNSTGKWILPLDADDKIHYSYLSKAVGKSDIVGANLQCFGKLTDIWKHPKTHPTYNDLLTRNLLFSCTLFKREVYDEIGGYDEEMFVKGKQGCNGYEDWDFWIRATKAGFKVTNLSDTLIYYRKNGNSMYSDALNSHDKIISYMKTKHPIKPR